MREDQIKTDATLMYHMNPTSLFSGRATDYALYRPSYPAEAITTILEGLYHPSHLVAADIGAGTGIGSRLLGDRGVKACSDSQSCPPIKPTESL